MNLWNAASYIGRTDKTYNSFVWTILCTMYHHLFLSLSLPFWYVTSTRMYAEHTSAHLHILLCELWIVVFFFCFFVYCLLLLPHRLSINKNNNIAFMNAITSILDHHPPWPSQRGKPVSLLLLILLLMLLLLLRSIFKAHIIIVSLRMASFESEPKKKKKIE